jgi:ABC-2 type transport system ATP-binding protein
VIETRGLVKRYGSTVALDGVDLRVPEGSVYGLVGPNGAGKTTLLGVLSGLRRASEGDVRIDADPVETAVLPDTPRFDTWLTGREVVDLARSLTAPTSADAPTAGGRLHTGRISPPGAPRRAGVGARPPRPP